MFCIYCGASNPNDASFCSKCGKHTAAPPQSAVAQTETPQATAATPVSMAATYVGARPPISETPQSPEVAATPVSAAATYIGTRPATSAAPQPAEAAAPPVQVPPPVAAKGMGSFLWVLGGIVLLVAVISVWAINRDRNAGSSSDSESYGTTPAPAPPADPPPQIIDDRPPVESAPARTPEDILGRTVPDNVVVPSAPPAPAPQNNSIVGTWTTPTALGTTTMELGGDGRYTVKGTFVDDYGIYVYSNDGSLQLQSKSFFDGALEIWHCQVNGNTMSVIEGKGGSHIWTRE